MNPLKINRKGSIIEIKGEGGMYVNYHCDIDRNCHSTAYDIHGNRQTLTNNPKY